MTTLSRAFLAIGLSVLLFVPATSQDNSDTTCVADVSFIAEQIDEHNSQGSDWIVEADINGKEAVAEGTMSVGFGRIGVSSAYRTEFSGTLDVDLGIRVVEDDAIDDDGFNSGSMTLECSNEITTEVTHLRAWVPEESSNSTSYDDWGCVEVSFIGTSRPKSFDGDTLETTTGQPTRIHAPNRKDDC